MPDIVTSFIVLLKSKIQELNIRDKPERSTEQQRKDRLFSSLPFQSKKLHFLRPLTPLIPFIPPMCPSSFLHCSLGVATQANLPQEVIP